MDYACTIVRLDKWRSTECNCNSWTPFQAQAAVAPPPPNSTIALPFIIINASKETSIDCQISSDKRDYLFNFNNSFEIHDDIEVLKRMGLAMDIEKGEATPDKVQQAKLMLPKALQPFVERKYLYDKGYRSNDSICCWTVW